METKTYRAIRHDVVRAKQKLLNTQVFVIGSLVAVAANAYGYDQWRITSTKLSKYDTE